MTAPEAGKAKGECDECGRNDRKIVRVHRGERFCGNCYKRMFKRRMCPQCGNFGRLPRFERDAVCLKCESARACVRCGDTEYRTGLRTPYGPACVACARYFKTAEPCDGCGTPSRWLSRRRKIENDLRLCPRCARADHGTCNACRRSRPLTESADGRKLCRPCAEQGEIPCPECKGPMPAGCGKRCWDCYWKQVTESRVELNAAGVVSPVLSQRLRDFGAWLIEERGPHKAALKINRYLDFFQEIDRQWNDIPGYEALLEHFGADGLRRYRLAMRWMKAAGLVVVDSVAREADSDRRRIAATLDRVKGCSTEAADILSGYHAALCERATVGKCSLRSIRMALSPAARLLEISAGAQILPPDQHMVDAFLRRSPGQQAAVSGFVTHLRRRYEIELAVPKRSPLQRQKARRAKLRPELLALMRDASQSETPDRRWIEIALQYFHDLPGSAGKKVADDDVTADGAGITVAVNGQSYWIPWPNRAEPSTAGANHGKTEHTA